MGKNTIINPFLIPEGKPIQFPKPERKTKLTGRRYDIVGYKLNGEVITRNNIPAIKANTVRKELRMAGCHRVDKIEVVTKVNGKPIQFTEKSHTPALVGRIPVTVTATEKKIADDRMKMHNRNVLAMMRKNNVTSVSNDDKIRIYDNDGVRSRNNKGKFIKLPKLIFVGNETEAVFFILNNLTKPLTSYTFYLPVKVVEGLR